MTIEEFQKTEIYQKIRNWFMSHYESNLISTAGPTDEEISLAKEVWLKSDKDNSDFVISQLHWHGYFD